MNTPLFDGIYLDHNATTPIKPAARDALLHALDFAGNASAVHKAGRAARRLLEEARERVIKTFNLAPRDVVVFTSGATEANNLALLGAGVERLIVSAIEHPSVLATAKASGLICDVIPVLPNGLIDLNALENILHGNTQQTVVSVMLVNNETGVIQPLSDVVKLARQHGALVHTDAVQAIGRISVDIQSLGVDFISLSGHKIGGPQGVGALIIANCNAITPLLRGGNQEKNLRAGTENIAGIAGLSAALAALDIAGFEKLAILRDNLEQKLASIDTSIVIFGKDAPRVANTSMFALPDAASETQLIALDLAGICVSNGSACSSGTVKASHVLKAMGVPENLAQCSLRVSLGWNSTTSDIDAFVTAWEKMHARLKTRKTNHA